MKLVKHQTITPLQQGTIDLAPLDRDEKIVVIERRTGVAWIVSGAIVGLLMILSFASWLVGELIRNAQLQATRAHELSMRAMELADHGAVIDTSWQPGYIAAGIMIAVGLLAFLRGIK